MSQVKAIAYYLPQFHPIPENDRWWGKGFTEWTNVTRGRPFFPGHHQPQLPADLGYYDLRVPEIRAAQADLARSYGLYGFCYYYYWFNGRRLLERPLDEVLRTGEPDFPFCICWANENWTRRWDGAEHEILMEQVHSPESDRRFIDDVLPILRDRRYIRVHGAPILLVYRAGILPDPRRTTDIWREVARAEGVGELHLCAVQSFGLDDPTALGFDSAAEFPPHGFTPTRINDRVEGLSPEFRGGVYDYGEAARLSLAKPAVSYRRYRGVMTSWDNTARRGGDGHVFLNSSPVAYEAWLRAAVAETETCDPDARLVFINAWNEWAEGAHLEPDQRYGHAWLEATARALRRRASWREVVRIVRERPAATAAELRGYIADLEFALEAQERSLAELDRQVDSGSRQVSTDLLGGADAVVAFRDEAPELKGMRMRPGARAHLDKVGERVAARDVTLKRDVPVTLVGWSFAPGIESSSAETRALLVLRGGRSRTWFAPITTRTTREDVAAHFARVDAKFTSRCGFSATVSLDRVPPGDYELGVVHAAGARCLAHFVKNRVRVE